MHAYFALVPKGLEEQLAEELRGFGAREVRLTKAGVSFLADVPTAYRILLWSRLCGRLLRPLTEFEARDPDQLYAGAKLVNWTAQMDLAHTFSIEPVVSASRIGHAQFAAQRVKDAVVDQFRARLHRRPSVDRQHPDVRLHMVIKRDRCTLSIDLGGSLHRRGYRPEGGLAPLKENLAASILQRAQWPEIAAEGGALIDPLCGSGTFLIEGAMMAADIAPGLLHDQKVPTAWLGFQPRVWTELREEAEARREAGLAKFEAPILGFDRSRDAMYAARANIARAGLAGRIEVERRDLHDWPDEPFDGNASGLVVTNPPYGARLGELPELVMLYTRLGHVLKTRFPGWSAAMLTAHGGLGKQTGLRAHRVYKLYNGTIPCQMLRIAIRADNEGPSRQESLALHDGGSLPISEGAAMVRNRLKKNLKQIGKWAAREGVGCYRIYDADLPEYNACIDRYGDYLLIQEYRAPAQIPAAKAERRWMEMVLVAPEVVGIPRDRVFLKTRERQKGNNQYQAQEEKGPPIEIVENGLHFWVDLHQYLDTGLFLDHRPIRARIRELCDGKRFLNLFAYTGTATVYAAAGGARETLTIDMSNTYLNWAERNMALNRLGGARHRFLRADCMNWLQSAKGSYDVIFLDPPSFSNSKKMDRVLDVQRDHVFLVTRAAELLAPGGVLFFSNNLKSFKLNKDKLSGAGLSVKDISRETIPQDFARNKRIHHCFEIRKG
ncbi:bifunctional 23S rRNA (guanine(2069)-N(7))-methyltransferase RlmK/23S rRNA (guanine(2445)-N(2))-methyltransferase RlmL [Sulfidibacter corallicola]|uniref:Ribosomal RNA large subunit methyltransferase K/L n=1 Tax=Sulfidibacter corallicola TaxID=2818388 RepID=A0A8A4TIF0_SULCO|nr:bifunctional 23S rRNA (guanine(2069)-N(7))-methyltransferase RlmK/23S rRNA (guanine(2445)-N(2))-methyltransferase RlmL [Sulfidibacter corallicola]QTD49819.1 bifunctional 23S rRNA (guanine(2069)-N(7))-methyltransferase RlmK/23S rRNA (guanine(2445)-N(2))-methyltransferase RlmL [Sulfidibacter corallicola]